MNDVQRPRKARNRAADGPDRGPGANPVMVEVTRGGAVESRHRGAAAVADASGALVASWGDVEALVYPRSAVKPLQALALIETGAAGALAVTDQEIALACASHGAEPAHVECVTGWIERIGLRVTDLECGAHLPGSQRAADAMIRCGRTASAVHNNCSGKHAAMLATARHMGEPTKGYVRPDHPVQRRIRALLGELTGCDLERAPVGIDGCSIPTIATPLAGLARAMARLADPDGLGAERAAAVSRVRRAMAAHPFLLAGTGRFDTGAIEATRGRVLVKSGAEGVYTAAVPALGLGIALKIDDGATRAAEVAITALLRAVGGLDDGEFGQLGELAGPVLRNWNGIEVGRVRCAPGWPHDD